MRIFYWLFTFGLGSTKTKITYEASHHETLRWSQLPPNQLESQRDGRASRTTAAKRNVAG